MLDTGGGGGSIHTRARADVVVVVVVYVCKAQYKFLRLKFVHELENWVQEWLKFGFKKIKQ